MEQINEEWRDIEGYEGLYQVSNLGKVRSLGNDKTRKDKILKPAMGKNGYLQVGLHKEGKVKRLLVHRLVAQVFIPNPEGLPIINHKDENPKNNVVLLKDDGSVDECRSNLEWCTQKYNCNYGTRIERQIQTKISNGYADPELCGIGDKKEYDCLYYQKKREKKLEYLREYRLKKKKNNKPSEESLW